MKFFLFVIVFFASFLAISAEKSCVISKSESLDHGAIRSFGQREMRCENGILATLKDSVADAAREKIATAIKDVVSEEVVGAIKSTQEAAECNVAKFFPSPPSPMPPSDSSAASALGGLF